MNSRDWYLNLNKSTLTPPNYVFSIVWSVLYLLLLISFLIIYKDPICFPFCTALIFFLSQLFFNLIWTPLFFQAKNIKLALLDLVFVIIFTIITIVLFYKINPLASYLLIPYILWLFLAFHLNYYIFINN
jgi:tryptophan-rich sensory protein